MSNTTTTHENEIVINESALIRISQTAFTAVMCALVAAGIWLGVLQANQASAEANYTKQREAIIRLQESDKSQMEMLGGMRESLGKVDGKLDVLISRTK